MREIHTSQDCLETLKNAEREISSFYRAVLELHGKQQAQKAARDWIELMEAMTSPMDATIRYWRRVTILAADRLASRICHAMHSTASD